MHGQIVHYSGQVWGISWFHADYSGEGWWYDVYFTECTHPEDISLPVWDVVHEVELKNYELSRTLSAVY